MISPSMRGHAFECRDWRMGSLTLQLDVQQLVSAFSAVPFLFAPGNNSPIPRLAYRSVRGSPSPLRGPRIKMDHNFCTQQPPLRGALAIKSPPPLREI